jgi:hypothetical protein
MKNEIEATVVVLARQRLKALQVALAGRNADLNAAQNAFHQLTGLTSLRFVQYNGLSEQTVHELIIMDHLALLGVQSAHPELIEDLSQESQQLAVYLDMPARDLLDFLFKHGQRFKNQEAVSVAIHRGLIDDVMHESDAYRRLAVREQRERQRMAD